MTVLYYMQVHERQLAHKRSFHEAKKYTLCLPSMLYFYHCIILDLESVIKHIILIKQSYIGYIIQDN